jgi:hypothetical protein
MDASRNTEFAQMQGAKKFLPRRIYADMQARKFLSNAAVEMKSEFMEVSTWDSSQ